ncbi:MAG: hypothetical protein QXT65_04475 [Candidatus Nitrosocaldaceae archaeon]
MIVVYDTEYDNRFEETYKYELKFNKKRYLNIIKYKEILHGIYIADIQTYKYFYDFYEMLDYLCTLDKEHHLFSFWNYAELGTMDLSKCDIEIIEDIGNSVMLTFRYKNTKFHLKDVKKLTGATNLDNFCKTFIGRTPKEHLKNYNHVYDMSKEQIIEYNKDDCISTYNALMVFYTKVNEIAKKQFNVELPPLTNFWSLGGIATYIITQLDKEIGFLSLEKYLLESDIEVSQRKIKTNKISNLAREIIKKLHEEHSYRGGGIIHNLLGLYSTSKHIKCEVHDFNSLFPVAGIVAANEMSENINDYIIIQLKLSDIYELLDKYKHKEINALVRVSLELRNNKPPICAEAVSIKINDHFVYKLCHPLKVKAQYYSLYELEELLNYGYVITEVFHAIVFKYGKITALTKWFSTLLTFKNNAESSEERQIYKLFLNISYGKLAEKRITKITNVIFASMLTSYARAFMINIVRNVLDRGDIIYHLATDSIFTSHYDSSYTLELQSKIREYYNITEIMKKEYEGKIHVLKLKCYVSDDKKKEAHLGITCDNPYEFWSSNLNEVFYMTKHKRCKINMLKKYLDFYQITLSDIQHLPANLTLKEAEQIIKNQILTNLAGKELIEKYLYIFKDDFKLRIKYSDADNIYLHQPPFWKTSDEYITFIEQLNSDYTKLRMWIKKERKSNPLYSSMKIYNKSYYSNIKLRQLN